MFKHPFEELLDTMEHQLDAIESYTHGGGVGVLSILYDELVDAGIEKEWVDHIIQNCKVSVQLNGVVANGEVFDDFKPQIERFAKMVSKVASGMINEVEANDWPEEKKEVVLEKALRGMSMEIE